MGRCIARMQDLGKGHGISRCSPTWKFCEPIHLGFLGEGSLHRHDWNHWPLMIELSFQCLCLPQRSRGWGGMNSSNLLIMPATRPHPCNQHPSLRTLQKSPHYHQLRYDWKGLAGSFPAGSVVKNPPVNKGDMGLITDPGRSHKLWGH